MKIADYIKKQNSKPQPSDGKTYVDPNEAVNKYSAMSEGDLMKELFKEGSVSNGKVSAQELDNFYKQASGFLSPEQRNKMRMLINQLKNS